MRYVLNFVMQNILLMKGDFMKKTASKRYLAFLLSVLVVAELLFVAGFSTSAETSETEFDPTITEFEEGNTVDEFNANSDYKLTASTNSGIVTNEGVSGNALNFKRASNTNGFDYDSKVTLKLSKNVEQSRGVSFMLKNPTARKLSLRIWIGVGTDKSSTADFGKYQVVFTIPADNTEYTKYTILWDDVGTVDFDSEVKWWGGSSSGQSLSAEEIASGITLRFVNGNGSIRYGDAGLLFDNFRYVTDEDFAKRYATLLDFSNCEAGGELPSNVTIDDDGYDGSYGIVEKEDGSKALQINFDKFIKNEGDELHQTGKRTNKIISVKIPKGSLKKIEKVHFNVTLNGYEEERQDISERIVFYTAAVIGENVFVKQGESAGYLVANPGETKDYEFQVKDGHAFDDFWYLRNHMSKKHIMPLTDEHYEALEEFRLYLAIPDIDAYDVEKGYNIQLNYVNLIFEEEPLYQESGTHMIFDGEKWRFDTTNESTITSTYNKISSNDINYRAFKQSFTIKAKEGNKASVITKNSAIKFLRNAEPYKESATFRIYTRSKVDTKAEIAFITDKGSKLPFEIDIKKSKTDKFDETTVSFKEIYDDYLASGGKKISLKNIVALEILPLSSSAVEFEVSSPTLWSKYAGSSSSAGNYYRTTEDDKIRIEAYQDRIPNTYEAVLEDLDIEATLEENSTRLPKGAKVLGIFKVALKKPDGTFTEPGGRFWVSYKIPDGVDLGNTKAYELFFDGSLAPIAYNSFDRGGYLSFEDFFSSKTFAILQLASEETSDDIDDNKEEQNNTEPQYQELTKEVITWEEVLVPVEPSDESDETTDTVIIREKIKKRKNKNNNDVGIPTWVWIVVAIGGAIVVIVAGVITFLIVRSKKNRGEKMTS